VPGPLPVFIKTPRSISTAKSRFAGHQGHDRSIAAGAGMLKVAWSSGRGSISFRLKYLFRTDVKLLDIWPTFLPSVGAFLFLLYRIKIDSSGKYFRDFLSRLPVISNPGTESNITLLIISGPHKMPTPG
jgi:hypothetical protein